MTHRRLAAGMVVGVVGVGLGVVALANLGGSPPAALDVDDVVLGIGATETSRNLAWSANSSRGCVEYASSADDVRVVEAHDSGERDGDPWFHATLTDLEPSAEYRYRVGDCAAAWSAPMSFTTDDGGSFSFLLFGDPQVGADGTPPGPGWATTLADAVGRFPHADFLLTTGDHVNATTNAGQTPQWELFTLPPALTGYPLAPTVGNHDEAYGTGVQFGERFALPNLSTVGETVAGNGNYWFRYNGALFMSLNTEDLDVAGHAAFLAETLGATDATWTVVSFHHGPFAAGVHVGDDDVVMLRETLTPVLSDLGIDLVLNGHDHSYARSFLMNGTAVVPGTGGPRLTPRDGEVLYLTANSSSGSKFFPLSGDHPWLAVALQDGMPSYTHVSVSRETLSLTTVRVPDGTVVDSVTLEREP